MNKLHDFEGVQNVYISPADGVDVSSVAYLNEARRLLEAIDKDKGEPLVFNDSRKK